MIKFKEIETYMQITTYFGYNTKIKKNLIIESCTTHGLGKRLWHI